MGFGSNLAGRLHGDSRNLFLTGELGSGKTTLLKGVGASLGIRSSEIVSPTFQLVRRYQGKRGDLIHLDLYRLASIEEILRLGWDELIEDEAVMAVEWAGRARLIWPDSGTFVTIEIISENERRFTISSNKAGVPGP